MANSGKTTQIKFVFEKLDAAAKAGSMLGCRTVPATQQHSYTISKVPSGNISCTRTRSVSKKSARSGKKPGLPPQQKAVVQIGNFISTSQPRSVASSTVVNSNRSTRGKKACETLNTNVVLLDNRKKGKTPSHTGNTSISNQVAMFSSQKKRLFSNNSTKNSIALKMRRPKIRESATFDNQTKQQQRSFVLEPYLTTQTKKSSLLPNPVTLKDNSSLSGFSCLEFQTGHSFSGGVSPSTKTGAPEILKQHKKCNSLLPAQAALLKSQI